MTDLETRALHVSGATLRYDIRGDLNDGGADDPVLVMAGSPMDASGFATLATYFTDRPVVTYDPRGTGRSVRTDGAQEATRRRSTPTTAHADRGTERRCGGSVRQ